MSTMSLSIRQPPNGSSRERRTKGNMKRLAKPLAASVRVSRALNSASVMWAMMDMCAPVEVSGLLRVIV